ncbi:MAG: nuclear transport factor 2 family protein [Blastocatellia bacterium]|nr:nuclear transport factor 2 family protein [Blastocatellia bacterium]
MKKLAVMTVALMLASSIATGSQSESEKEAVRQAVLDYVEGVYEVDPARIERSVHPDLAKRGYYIKRGETGYSSAPMNFQQLIEVAKNWNKNKRDMSKAPKEVVVYEVLDQTASAKLTAAWGIDYMHLAKYSGKWMIVNVLWQSHPPKAGEGRK